MPIKVNCGNCSASFKAKDELAGRRVKCPKCQKPVVIPELEPVAPVAVAKPKRAANPLLDLLDEENVQSVARGPICNNCGVEVKPHAVICIDCGFNLETGDRLSTQASEDDEDAMANLTGTEQIMRKAEREIEEVPVLSNDDDFGDGAESYLIAMVAGFFGIIMLGIALAVILSMEQLTLIVAPAAISLFAAIVMYLGMAAWLSIVAFKVSPAQGIGCVASVGLYCPIFGFMQGKTLLLPAIVMLISIVMILATSIYVSYNGWLPAV